MASFMQRTIRGYNNPSISLNSNREILALCDADYILLLRGQRDKTRRMFMKRAAYHVMYGSDPDALIHLPAYYLDSVELDKEPD
jgi:hypothetical protein